MFPHPPKIYPLSSSKEDINILKITRYSGVSQAKSRSHLLAAREEKRILVSSGALNPQVA